MAHRVLWKEMSARNDETGKSEVIKQGDLVPDYVGDFTRFALVQTGAIAFVADEEVKAEKKAASSSTQSSSSQSSSSSSSDKK
jgi:hypothetical protein